MESPGISSIGQAMRDADCFPPTVPPVTLLVPAQDGTLWLRREDMGGDSIRWDVVGREGTRVGRLRLPREHRVVAAAGNTMAAIERDEFGVEYVVRYELSR